MSADTSITSIFSSIDTPAAAAAAAAAASPSRTAPTAGAKRGAKTGSGHPASSYLLLFLLLPVFLLLALAAQPVACGPAEDRLIATVLKGYNPLARPVEDGAVDVWFGMGLIQILQIVEVEQTVKSNVWLRLIWIDGRLDFNPDDYDGVQNIRLPFDSVWNPEIVLFNNANGVYEVNFKSNVVVYPGGYVLWVPPALFVSSCSIDVRYFPFDEQKCEMIFGSWTYNSDQVRLLWYDGWTPETSNPYAVMGDYARSGSWDVTLVPGVIKTDQERKITNTFFYLHLRRKTLFFILNLIIPCVVIAILCWFTFLLPSTSGEKVGYAITLLLGLMVFLLLLFTVLPATSESVPLMAQFLLFIYIVNVVTIILCVWIIGYSFRLPSTHFMSDGVRALFLNLLPPLIFMRRPEGEPHVHEPRFKLDESIEQEEVRRAAANTGRRIAAPGGGGSGSIMTNSGHSLDGGRSGNAFGGGVGVGPPPARGFGPGLDHLIHRGHNNPLTTGGGGTNIHNNNNNNNNNPLSDPLSPEVVQAAKDVRYIAERASSNNEDDQVSNDWMYIGLVLDSFTFWVTGAVIILGTAYFLMSAPNSFGSVDQGDLVENWDANHCRIFFNGDYKLFSHATADEVTITTMTQLCCAHFYSKTFAEKTSKYSNETADAKEVERMNTLCGKGGAKRKKRDVSPGKEVEEEEMTEMRYVSGVRGGGGPLAIPASGDTHRKHRRKQEKATEEARSNLVDFKAHLQSKGLDFDAEWRAALKENLAMMRTGEQDMRRVDDLVKRPARGGLRHNATKVG